MFGESDHFGEGDDAGHCTNAITARKFREATDEERTIYRKWLHGIAAFYCTLLLAVCAVGFMTSNKGRTQLSHLTGYHAPSKAD